MAYALRYTLSQILRNGNTQTIEVYEDGYVGSVKTYIPTSITLQPSSSEEYPYPAIITSQLNFSFVLETADDYTQFPDVLSVNDRLYYVLLKESSTVIWRGYLFNDYSQVGFSTGISEASLVAIDGISFLQEEDYVVDGSINLTVKHLELIGTALRLLAYPSTDLFLNIACSFFATGMATRTNSQSNEPFNQIYQYRRDFVGVSYYTILDNILKTFNCRMYQANGDWYITSTMEVAATTRYYTRYAIGVSTITVNSYGQLTNTIDIQPHSQGGVHFINNSQTKILRKGFYDIEVRSEYTSPINLIHDANLKIVSGIYPATTAEGWFTAVTGSATASVFEEANEQFNSYILSAGTGYADLQILAPGPTFYPYTPYLGGTSATFSCEHKNGVAIKIQVALLDTGSGNKYLDNNGDWQTSSATFITFPAATGDDSDYDTYTLSIPPYWVSLSAGTFLMGYLNIKVRCDSGSTQLRNFKLVQDSTEVKYAVVQNSLTSSKSTTKVFEQPYGQVYPNLYGQQVLSLGSLYSSAGVYLTGWNFLDTGMIVGGDKAVALLAYQYIKIFQRNIATLEADLGETEGVNGYAYLDKVYTVTDTTTGDLSYSGKKFAANRLTLSPYNNQTNSLQLMEIYYDSTFILLIPTYITDVGQLGPFWFLNIPLDINHI